MTDAANNAAKVTNQRGAIPRFPTRFPFSQLRLAPWRSQSRVTPPPHPSALVDPADERGGGLVGVHRDTDGSEHPGDGRTQMLLAFTLPALCTLSAFLFFSPSLTLNARRAGKALTSAQIKTVMDINSWWRTNQDQRLYMRDGRPSFMAFILLLFQIRRTKHCEIYQHLLDRYYDFVVVHLENLKQTTTQGIRRNVDRRYPACRS